MLSEILKTLGLLGLFLAALLGHSSIVMKDFFFVPLFLYMAGERMYPAFILGIIGGFGSALGELSPYLLGRGVRKLVADGKREVPIWVKKLGIFSVLLVSATPLPDAPVLVLLGTAKFSVFTVLLLEMVGKVAYYTVGAYVGGVFYPYILSIFPEPWGSLSIVLTSVIVATIITRKIKYER